MKITSFLSNITKIPFLLQAVKLTEVGQTGEVTARASARTDLELGPAQELVITQPPAATVTLALDHLLRQQIARKTVVIFFKDLKY